MLSRKRTKPGSTHPITDSTNGKDEESLFRRIPDSNRTTRSSASLFKIIIHKICNISGAGDKQKGRDSIIGLLQDIVGGIVLGTLGMSILLLLDYSNIINLMTARVFRKTASDVFRTPNFDSIEIDEENGKMLLPINAYNAMKKELSDSQAAIHKEQKIVDARTNKATSLKAELSSLKVEYDRLMKETGLDVWCPTCRWGMGLTCLNRVEYLLETYSDSATTIECITKLVKQGKCLTPTTE